MKKGNELIQLKITYDKNLEEIEIFLETGKTKIKLFWKRAEVWNLAWYNAIYSEAKLKGLR